MQLADEKAQKENGGEIVNRLMTQGLTAARVALWPPNNQAFAGYQEGISSGIPAAAEGADFINQINAGMVRQQAHRGAKAAHAKGEAENRPETMPMRPGSSSCA